nr:ATP-binding protein [Adlercreutzia sp. ZJ154]
MSQRRLSSTVNSLLLAFTLSVVLALTLVFTALYYFIFEGFEESRLEKLAQNIASEMNVIDESERLALMDAQVSADLRYTLIDENGEVVFDSVQSQLDNGEYILKELDNHSNRPEFQGAVREGTAYVIRYSDTLKKDMLYAAVRLDDGAIVRLAEPRESLIAFAARFVVPIVIVILVVAVLVVVFSKLLTKRIMRPLDNMDVTEPLKGEGYSEMSPLLARIDDQRLMLERQNEDLARADSMRRDFSANVSHELKTPLQVIVGYTELMEGGLVSQEDIPKFSRIIHEEAENMRSLIDDVLTLSRLDSGSISASNLKDVDLFILAKQVADRLAPIANKKDVDIRVSGESVFIEGDESLLDEMMSNLITNAIRYNVDNGYVDVIVGERVQPAKEAVVVVRDAGIGMPEDELTKIFERFYRIDKSRSKETGGTGLGLAIVKHAALSHNGQVQVESKLGQGSTFTVTIPIK